MASAQRVNVSHTSPDIAVQQVLDKIDREVLVVDALGDDGVEGVIAQLARRGGGEAFGLDLIAHSRGGVLQLGEWTVDGNGTSSALQRACATVLAKLPLREIRLLGCNTAVTPAGQAAMRGLHKIFDTRVLGTRAPIYARDFSSTGFQSTALLSDHSNLLPSAVPTLASTAGWFQRLERIPAADAQRLRSRLRREALSDVIRDWARARPQHRWPIRELDGEQFEAILEHAEPAAVFAPGLLALPDLEVVVRLVDDFGAPRYHRLTVLVEGFWLRVYPRDRPDGVVLRTDGAERLLEALRRGTELLRP